MFYQVVYESPCGIVFHHSRLTELHEDPPFWILREQAADQLVKILKMQEWSSPQNFKIEECFNCN